MMRGNFRTPSSKTVPLERGVKKLSRIDKSKYPQGGESWNENVSKKKNPSVLSGYAP